MQWPQSPLYCTYPVRIGSSARANPYHPPRTRRDVTASFRNLSTSVMLGRGNNRNRSHITFNGRLTAP